MVLYLSLIKRMITLIAILFIFLTSNILIEKYLIKRVEGKLTTFKVLLIGLGVEFLFLTLAAHNKYFEYILIGVTIVISSFISSFYRNQINKINGGH